MTRQYTDQKFEDTKDVIRRRKSQMTRPCNDQKFETIKDVIRRRKSQMASWKVLYSSMQNKR